MGSGLAAARRPGTTVCRLGRALRDPTRSTADAVIQGAERSRPALPTGHSGARVLAREPGIHNRRLGLWVPGSPLRGAPERQSVGWVEPCETQLARLQTPSFRARNARAPLSPRVIPGRGF